MPGPIRDVIVHEAGKKAKKAIRWLGKLLKKIGL